MKTIPLTKKQTEILISNIEHNLRQGRTLEHPHPFVAVGYYRSVLETLIKSFKGDFPII